PGHTLACGPVRAGLHRAALVLGAGAVATAAMGRIIGVDALARAPQLGGGAAQPQSPGGRTEGLGLDSARATRTAAEVNGERGQQHEAWRWLPAARSHCHAPVQALACSSRAFLIFCPRRRRLSGPSLSIINTPFR